MFDAVSKSSFGPNEYFVVDLLCLLPAEYFVIFLIFFSLFMLVFLLIKSTSVFNF